MIRELWILLQWRWFALWYKYCAQHGTEKTGYNSNYCKHCVDDRMAQEYRNLNFFKKHIKFKPICKKHVDKP